MAKLVRDHSAGARAVDVFCFVPHGDGKRRVRLSETVIDLDGPAFEAYYCPDHAPEGSDRAVCPDDYCVRCCRRGC